MNGLTINLHLMMETFYRPSAERFRVLMEEPVFPSDLYAVQSQVRRHGFLPDDALLMLKPGPGEYDKDLIALNQVLKHRGRYYAYYHGSAKAGPNARLWSTAVATSTDLIHWEKYPGNPIIDQNASSGILVEGPYGARFYTMHPDVRLYVSPKSTARKD